jgi:hypothetical protein
MQIINKYLIFSLFYLIINEINSIIGAIYINFLFDLYQFKQKITSLS